VADLVDVVDHPEQVQVVLGDGTGAHERAVQPLHQAAPVLDPTRNTGKGVTFLVCISVSASNSSSIVPNPPGNTTKAVEYLTSITLRTKKYRNFSSSVW
jgi:hypothetical protein